MELVLYIFFLNSPSNATDGTFGLKILSVISVSGVISGVRWLGSWFAGPGLSQSQADRGSVTNCSKFMI